MNIIKLNLNWVLQVSKLLLLIAVLVAVNSLFAVNLKITLVTLLPLILLITILTLLEVRFFHCYKAGICYSRGLGKRYLNSDEIKGVSFKKYLFINILNIQLQDNKQLSFYNWRIDNTTQTSIIKLYSEEKNSISCSEPAHCNA